MADNAKPSEDPLVAADEIGGAKVQRVKVMHGADNSGTDVSEASPMPVEDSAAATLLTGLGVLLTAIEADTGPLAALLSTIDADTGGILTAVQTLDNAISGSEMQVDIVGPLPGGTNNIGDVDLASALPAGTNAIGKLAANSGVDIGDVDVTSISAGPNLIGDVGLRPRTSGGLTIFRSIDVDETEEAIKEAAGQLYGYYFANRAAGERFLKFYNATPANVTVGTTTPVLTLPLPEKSSGHVPIPQGIAFATAITVAATTGIADNDTGAPGANDVVLNAFYA